MSKGGEKRVSSQMLFGKKGNQMLFDLGGEIKSYKREKKRAMREKLVHGTRGRKRKREWVFLLWYFFMILIFTWMLNVGICVHTWYLHLGTMYHMHLDRGR